MMNLVQNFRFSALCAAVVGSSLLASCAKDSITANDPTPATGLNSSSSVSGQAAGKYIVVLKDESVNLSDAGTEDSNDERTEARFAARSAKVRDVAQGVLRQRGLRSEQVGRTYNRALKGFSADLTKAEAADLAQDSRVAYVEFDQPMSIEQTTATTTTASTQVIQYGVKRVGYGSGVGKTVWILDTGVDLTHPDLTVDKTRSRTFYPIGDDALSANDLNGHGTHVAGIIAAKNNTVGVMGVAAGANVVAVKVMNATGSSSSSVVIAGLDYVAANAKAGDVVNMSLGGGISQSLDDAVIRVANKGVLFAIAAGNDAKNVTMHSPARVNHANVFTVTAMNNLDSWASFSCFGSPTVDYCMPGVAIKSTYKAGGYAAMSGTSMAAPHMAGVLLMRGKAFTRSGNVKLDPDGTADRIAHL
ncbi:S8 family serine peptidase [Hymenobacter guriensis]|uniref:S8 family serine peptidase n=1 Tax=Hymenobacter guriensis TaxID=2793065 RepID=A0ABS0L458_9BACT|nr:S8 family serine peptidase [Hymenobacter guriensis]MBG8554919.1 S8 family serine peptidase [Hymenobacter guriensis]